ncbi:MAG: type II toxin-antitoxin system ParD family antitoxin [bacterium]|nr:type II toxin-antitoxin system ParD family antitoxin [bacterium]
MPTRNVVLTDRQAAMVTRLVGSGRYQNASEVIREGLRLIERREIEDDARLRALREAVDIGATDIDEGRYRDFDTTESLRDHLSAKTNEALADRPPHRNGNR